MDRQFRSMTKNRIQMTDDEVVSLINQAQSGDESASTVLMENNLGLVTMTAARLAHLNKSMDLDDLIGYGVLGLNHAIHNYDVSRGTKFSTFAVLAINQEILRSIKDYGRLVRLPQDEVRKSVAIRRVVDAILVRTGKRPTDEEIAIECNIVGRNTIATMESRLDDSVSLNMKMSDDEDGDELIDNLEGLDVVEDFEGSEFRTRLECKVEDMLGSIPAKERLVVEYFYGFHGDQLTMVGVGDAMGITKQAVDQRLTRAIRRLRSRYSKSLREFML